MKPWAKAFYKSDAWKKARHAYIAYRQSVDGGMCEMCHEKPGFIVHHKIELTPDNINNPDVSLNADNFMWVCKDCHDIIHDYCGRRIEDGKRIVLFDENGNPVRSISPPEKNP